MWTGLIKTLYSTAHTWEIRNDSALAAGMGSVNGSCGTTRECDGVDGQGDKHSTSQHTVGSHISQRTLADIGSASALAAVLAVDMGL